MTDQRQIRAAVCRAFGEPLSVEPVLLAPPAEGEVRVRVEACAICHSDVALVDDAWGGDLPSVFGHEACGVVEEAGPGVTAPAVGDRVVVGLIRWCGECARCRGGEPALCAQTFALDRRSPISELDGGPIGHGLRCGGFAEQVVVHASQAVAVPPGIEPAQACLIACGVMTGMGAVQHTAGVEPGSAVVVIGTGGVGLNAIQGAVLAGAAQVIAVDISAAKLATARGFGATAAVDAGSDDVVAAVLAATGGGADYVFTTVGSARVVEQGIACLRRGGALVVVGMPASGQMAAFDPSMLAHDGKRILGSKMGSALPAADVPRIAALYTAGDVHLDELVSGTYPLDRINEAMDAMRSGAAVRNVIVF